MPVVRHITRSRDEARKLLIPISPRDLVDLRVFQSAPMNPSALATKQPPRENPTIACP